MSNATAYQINADATSADLVDLIGAKLDQARAMALVVGSEGFSDWSTEVRANYGVALAELIDLADKALDAFKDRNVDAK